MRLVTGALFLLVGLLVIVGQSFAQVPNAGFENWSNGDPVSWYTNNGLYTFVTQVSPGHGGSASAQGAVTSMGGFNMSPSLTTQQPGGGGFPISQRYAEIRGFYKFNSVGGDIFYVNYLAQLGDAGVGAGAYAETNTQSTFKEFVAPILYPGSDVPDNGIVSFSITGLGSLPHIGSYYIVDDISLTSATDVASRPNGIPKTFALEQNFPNPFNPTTNIIYDIPTQSHVTLSVFDVLGHEVTTIVNEVQSAGRYKAVLDASRLASGVYFYRIQAGSYVQTRKMTVVK